MRQPSMVGSGIVPFAVVALSVAVVATRAAGVVVNVGAVEGVPGQPVVFSVTIDTEGTMVSGTQSDIAFEPETLIAAAVDGQPQCTANPDLNLGLGLTFQPPGCALTTAGDGVGVGVPACSAIRATVRSVDVIPDDSLLYTCAIAIAPEAGAGDYALVITNGASSDPDGMALPTTGTDGVVVVVDGAAIVIGSAIGQPAGIAPIDVVLFTNLEVATTQNEIAVGLGLAIATDGFGEPDCTVNPDIGKDSTTFTFQPSGCLPGEDCTSMQARVDGPDSTPIPSGSVLYTCTVEIASNVSTGKIPLRNTNPLASGPNGDPLLTIGTDGVVIVSREATIAIGSSVGQPGSTVFIDVVLSTELEIASLQNDIVFRPQARISATDLGSPDCAINAAIGAGDATFSFQPNDCTPQSDCTSVRAHIEGLTGTPIPVDSVLYGCTVEIAADAVGAFPLTCVNAVATGPFGAALETNCTTGQVVVGSEPGDAVIVIESLAGAEPGSVVQVGVSLLGREGIAATQNDITFAAEAAIIADEGGRPLCVVNPQINKFGVFGFQPPGCVAEAISAAEDVGVAPCTGIRALVLTTNQDTIPSGSVVYTCTVATAPNVTGVFALTCSGHRASDPAGNAIQTDCIDGEVEVGASIPTPTSTPVPPTPTPGTSGSCQIGAPTDVQLLWLLLIPALLVWLRRCSVK